MHVKFVTDESILYFWRRTMVCRYITAIYTFNIPTSSGTEILCALMTKAVASLNATAFSPKLEDNVRNLTTKKYSIVAQKCQKFQT